MENPTGTGNVTLDTAFAADGFHLTAGTHADIKGGGKELDEFTTDKDGNPRTVPWSMGAYEQN